VTDTGTIQKQRHSGESRNPEVFCFKNWTPAYAGVTVDDILFPFLARAHTFPPYYFIGRGNAAI
jgi:hypothetical protein